MEWQGQWHYTYGTKQHLTTLLSIMTSIHYTHFIPNQSYKGLLVLYCTYPIETPFMQHSSSSVLLPAQISLGFPLVIALSTIFCCLLSQGFKLADPLLKYGKWESVVTRSVILTQTKPSIVMICFTWIAMASASHHDLSLRRNVLPFFTYSMQWCKGGFVSPWAQKVMEKDQ